MILGNTPCFHNGPHDNVPWDSPQLATASYTKQRGKVQVPNLLNRSGALGSVRVEAPKLPALQQAVPWNSKGFPVRPKKDVIARAVEGL